MRRLPIYFLIDVSESMVGEQIQMVEEGMASIIKQLKTDPHALETVHVSILVFAGKPKTLIPLQDIVSFYPPRIPIGSGTSLGAALMHLMKELKVNIVKTTAEIKGDWKPIIFLFTDGVPTDETKTAIAEWNQKWRKSSNLVAVSFGDEASVSTLCELTDNVLMFKDTNASSYEKFFKWVTASIRTSSISVENNTGGFELAQVDPETATKIDLRKEGKIKQSVDPNYVVLAGKCQQSKRPYLMKYKRLVQPSEFKGMETLSYRLVGAYQVDQTYTELSDGSGTQQQINTEELEGAPTCPCCGNQIAFAVCSCQNIHCIGNKEVNTCPWCGNEGRYTAGNGGFNVNRTQG